jgi:hypothetical protein
VATDRLEHPVDVAPGVLGGQPLRELDHLVDDHRGRGHLVRELVGPEPEQVAVDGGHAGHRPPARELLDELVELPLVVSDALHQRSREPVEFEVLTALGREDLVEPVTGGVRVRERLAGVLRVELVEQHPGARVVDDAREERVGGLAADVRLEEDLQRTLPGPTRVTGVRPTASTRLPT